MKNVRLFPLAPNGMLRGTYERMKRECAVEIRAHIDDAIRRVEAATERKRAERAKREAELRAVGIVTLPRKRKR